MMFIFRSTFITAVSAFMITLSLFSMSASAVPQFGRPMFHVLDASATSSGPVEAVPTSAATSTGTDPDPGIQVNETASSSSASTTTTTTMMPAASSTSTSGASRSLCGGMSVILGVVVSGVWLVF
ncbi:uncharacterized protein F5891DRAFT_1191765 [Suillus fuscotomentosus]|uniref:Uncharacterized protein n=1 Tax=Suillus fuscotomentosus TaxID=1912939 RepID=A0AAD4E0P1_9AGAM|nr:uncharacterized protein F5891DRAFT_1191765 [Suillus fuscotomentosus]KAG1897565.1 hypothetical protein F5891DRAFT_1191765 [Suillus fuscotomentosus]